METINETVYLKKSVFFYKTYTQLLGFAIVISMIFGGLLRNNREDNLIFDLIVGLPPLIALPLVPIGLICSLMSYKNQEGNSNIRFKYLIRHIVACLLIVMIIIAMMTDISKLFE